MKIGVLAVQGAFIEHEMMLKNLGCECIELRQKSDIKNIDGLVLPGGESTVQGKLIRDLEMQELLKNLITSGIPTMATCAGLILLAQKITNDPQVHLGTLPVTVTRNAYGRQLGSFQTTEKFSNLMNIQMTFIRAPVIENCQKDVNILSTVKNKIVAVEYKNQIGLSFHPELGTNPSIHEYFLSKIK